MRDLTDILIWQSMQEHAPANFTHKCFCPRFTLPFRTCLTLRSPLQRILLHLPQRDSFWDSASFGTEESNFEAEWPQEQFRSSLSELFVRSSLLFRTFLNGNTDSISRSELSRYLNLGRGWWEKSSFAKEWIFQKIPRFHGVLPFEWSKVFISANIGVVQLNHSSSQSSFSQFNSCDSWTCCTKYNCNCATAWPGFATNNLPASCVWRLQDFTNGLTHTVHGVVRKEELIISVKSIRGREQWEMWLTSNSKTRWCPAGFVCWTKLFYQTIQFCTRAATSWTMGQGYNWCTREKLKFHLFTKRH